jgi:hypothetical protein
MSRLVIYDLLLKSIFEVNKIFITIFAITHTLKEIDYPG